MGSARNQLSSINEPAISFFFRLGFYQLYLACGGEERWWEKKKGMTHNS